MPVVSDDVIRLRMEALGAEGLSAMESKAKLLEGSLELLGQELKKGAVSETEFENAAREMIAELAKAKNAVAIGQEIQATRKAIDDQAAAMQRAAASFADYAASTGPVINQEKAEALARQRATESLAEYAGMARRVEAIEEQEVSILQRLNVTLDRTAAATRTASVSTSQFGGSLDKAAANADRANRSIGRSASGVTQSFIGLSRATQDLAQGGVGGILNNVEQVMAMAGPKIAGAATIIATAAYVAWLNWDKLKGIVEAKIEVPPVDGSSLDGLKDQLGEVNEQIDELRKKGSITIAESGQLAQLESAKKELEQSQAAAQQVKQLRDLKTQQEEKTAEAFVKSLKEAGAAGILDKIKAKMVESAGEKEVDGHTIVKDAFGKEIPWRDIEGKRRRLKELAKINADKAVEMLTKGDQEAFDLIQGVSDSMFGPLSNFSQLLKANNPVEKAKRKIEEFLNHSQDAMAESAHKENVEIEEYLKGSAKIAAASTEEAMKAVATFQVEVVDGLKKEGIDKVLERSAKEFNEILVKARAEGKNADEQADLLYGEIKWQLEKLVPGLERFPAAMRNTIRAIMKKVVDDADKMLDQMAREQGITVQQLQQRRAQAEAERRQGIKDDLAKDAFTKLAGQMGEQARRMNPNAPAMTPQQQRAMGEQMKAHFDELGIDAGKQADLARLFGSRKLGNNAHDLANSLSNQGMDEKTVLERVLAVYQKNGGQMVNVGAETIRQVNQMARLQGQFAQRLANMTTTQQRTAQLIERNQDAFSRFSRTASMTER